VDKAVGRILRRETAEKQVMSVRTETGTARPPVPPPKRPRRSSTDAQAVELAKLGAKIEKLYSMPMDVEWTLANGKFAIVQPGR